MLSPCLILGQLAPKPLKRSYSNIYIYKYIYIYIYLMPRKITMRAEIGKIGSVDKLSILKVFAVPRWKKMTN